MSTEWLEVGYVRDPDPVEVARAALCEAGREDLAAGVEANKAGWPSVVHTSVDRDVIAKAFWLAHIATCHREARLGRDLDGQLGIYCPLCWSERDH